LEINRIQQMQVKITGKRPDELAREKYDKEVKELQARNQNLENYLNLLISNIDRKELQDVLEKPIDTDPLKKLAFIFSHEAEDLQVNESMNPNILLSLDFFTKIEQSFR
jgi:phosphopantetheine adenylyltransferase